MNPQPLGWFGIFRLGLVQAAIGAIVVITTSTLNRVLVVELALPAMIPGALVALHYFVQILRPRLGYSSDVGGRRTPWIIGGMGVLGFGAVLASLATAIMATHLGAGLALGVVAFLVIGGESVPAAPRSWCCSPRVSRKIDLQRRRRSRG